MTTPAQVRAARDYLGADIPALGDLLGVNERTIRRWEAGTTPIPEQVADDLWDLIDAHQRTVDRYVKAAKETGRMDVHRPATGDHDARVERHAAAQAWAEVPDAVIVYVGEHDPMGQLS